MKKRNILLMICICLFALTGCGNTQMDEKKSTVLFKATVIEISEGGILVEPMPASDERASGDRIDVPNKDGLELQAGDIIAIEYDGSLLETYPLQLGEVYGITLMEQAQQDDSED